VCDNLQFLLWNCNIFYLVKNFTLNRFNNPLELGNTIPFSFPIKLAPLTIEDIVEVTPPLILVVVLEDEATNDL